MSSNEQARADFQTARRKAFWRRIRTWLVRGDNALLAFEDVRRRLHVQAQHEGGNREVPIDQIVGSVGRYRDFDRAFLPREIGWDEAVQSWYDRVYRPTVDTIRTSGALRDFPHRTEGDLYLWITEHHWYLHQQGLPRGHGLERVVSGYAKDHSTRPLKRLRRTIRRSD